MPTKKNSPSRRTPYKGKSTALIVATDHAEGYKTEMIEAIPDRVTAGDFEAVKAIVASSARGDAKAAHLRAHFRKTPSKVSKVTASSARAALAAIYSQPTTPSMQHVTARVVPRAPAAMRAMPALPGPTGPRGPRSR